MSSSSNDEITILLNASTYINEEQRNKKWINIEKGVMVEKSYFFGQSENRNIYSQSNTKIMFDGTIYNYMELYNNLDVSDDVDDSIPDPNSVSECVCWTIIHLYKKYGIKQALKLLDGNYSFVLIDAKYTDDYVNMYVCQSPFAPKPFYYKNDGNFVAISQSTDTIREFFLEETTNIMEQGSYLHYQLSHMVLSNWKFVKVETFFLLGISTPLPKTVDANTIDDNCILNYCINIKNLLFDAFLKRIGNEILDEEHVLNCNNSVDIPSIWLAICNYMMEERKVAVFTEIGTDYIKISNGKKISNLGLDILFGNLFTHIDNPIDYDVSLRQELSNIQLSRDPNILYPFLDTALIQYFFSIPLYLRYKERNDNNLLICAFMSLEYDYFIRIKK
jgi:hypothetical protein